MIRFSLLFHFSINIIIGRVVESYWSGVFLCVFQHSEHNCIECISINWNWPSNGEYLKTVFVCVCFLFPMRNVICRHCLTHTPFFSPPPPFATTTVCLISLQLRLIPIMNIAWTKVSILFVCKQNMKWKNGIEQMPVIKRIHKIITAWMERNRREEKYLLYWMFYT